jgi:voltage-gated sodium channel
MQTLKHIVESKHFEHLVLLLICANAALLGAETYPAILQRYGDTLHMLDRVFIAFFSIEILMRLAVYRERFFRKGWNIFDFCIVALTLLPFVGNLSALRTVRVLRALRLVSSVGSFRKVTESIIGAVRDFAAVLAVLLVVCYVYAVLASQLFGASHADQFGDVGVSLFTLFQIITLDNWSDIVRTVMTESPIAIPFFISFIVLTVFLLLSVIVGIASNAVRNADPEEKSITQKQAEEIIALLQKLNR